MIVCAVGNKSFNGRNRELLSKDNENNSEENLTPLNCNPETVYSSVTNDDIKKYSAIIHESLNLVKNFIFESNWY